MDQPTVGPPRRAGHAPPALDAGATTTLIFFINVPVGIVGTVLAVMAFPRSARPAAQAGRHHHHRSFSALDFLPQFLQQVQGIRELDSGLVLLPGALVLVVLMPIAGRIFDLIGPRYPAVAGLAFLALGSVLLAHITVDTPARGHRGGCGAQLRVGLCMMPIITAGPTRRSTSRWPPRPTQRLLGGVDLGVVGMVLAAFMRSGRPAGNEPRGAVEL